MIVFPSLKDEERQVLFNLTDRTEENISRQIDFDNGDVVRSLLGEHDQNIKQIEKLSDTRLHIRGNAISISGNMIDVERVEKLLLQLYAVIQKGYPLYPSDIEYANRILSGDGSANIERIFLDKVFISSKKKIITPKSIAQKLYIDSIRKHDIVFAIGPAGTGKTYLAMAMAVAALLEKKVRRIVLARPAVEAGEKLGFLPGDLAEKVNPYLRPLYDALYDMVDVEQASLFISKGIIEVAPLAFMRGRTLNDSFVILDEAQNTTPEQMKMFLTRLGFDSKAVITGDVTQIDLPSEKFSGLIHAEKVLHHIEGIKFIHFSAIDVVRHPLVQEIIGAYDKVVSPQN